MLDKFIILSQVKNSTWELKPQFVFVIFERTRNIFINYDQYKILLYKLKKFENSFPR